jgi:hypothetical protein
MYEELCHMGMDRDEARELMSFSAYSDTDQTYDDEDSNDNYEEESDYEPEMEDDMTIVDHDHEDDGFEDLEDTELEDLRDLNME